MRNRRLHFWLPLVGILLLASALRFYNLDWDSGQHLHPDERYLTMVAAALRFPGEAGQGDVAAPSSYWDTKTSAFNPATYDEFTNYVYGTLPLFATRAVALWLDNACVSAEAVVPSLYRSLVLRDATHCAAGHHTGYAGIHLVGRSLSAFADLLSIAGLIALASIAFGRKAGLLAGFLYALAPLPIQHAHFFVVDSFATVFVVWALVFCVWSVRRQKPTSLILAGLATGLAVASKISVWPLATIVTLAGVLRAEPEPKPCGRRLVLKATPSAIAHLVLAGGAAALAFRCAQPYAFVGPRFWDVGIDPTWLANVRDIARLMRGLRDVPFGHQWTARAPVIFPWRNMVIWGLGLPLGVAAWLSFVWLSLRLLRRHSSITARVPAQVLLWVWGTGYFLYQSTQWVKSMRYLLPVYPVFAGFAGWGLANLISQATSRRSGCRRKRTASRQPGLQAIARPLAQSLAYAVVVGVILWCFAFMAIYRSPVTRITASEWMYDNIPTAVQLVTDDGRAFNVPWQPTLALGQAGADLASSYEAPASTSISAVLLTKVSGAGLAGVRRIQVRVGDWEAMRDVDVPAIGHIKARIELPRSARLAQGERLTVAVSLLDGAPCEIASATIANEHWDDPLPLRIAGRDAFWGWYQGLASSPTGQINAYDEDSTQKRRQLLNWLDEADYIVLSSNRLYASIPRLPRRYPLTSEYYRLLLGGRLGFELAAQFVSYPSLGPCQLPDQEIPFELAPAQYSNARSCSIALPPAEEAFSVYDHPTVLVFRKADDFSLARVEEQLPSQLASAAIWMTPREATRTGTAWLTGTEPDPSSLLLSPRMREAQARGGTWSKLFDTRSLLNRNHRVAAVVWALFLGLLGWLAFPVVYLAFPHLRCRGYGLARIVGLLIWSYLAWLVASLRLLPFTRPVLWGVLAVLALASLLVARRHATELREFVAQNWRRMLLLDALFITLYCAWVGVRWMNPDLWHPVVGGEKPMDFAYLNAIIKSTWFPPYDPWFSGGQLNYYYFGFVLIASVIKALGIVPSVAYNLAVPALFAFTGVGGFTLASNLVKSDRRRSLRAGLWGLALVVLLGNLGEVRLLAKGFAEVGNVQFESLIPGYPELVSVVVGAWQVVVRGVSLNFRPEWWYWDATRIIPVQPGEVGPINEFPAFTFLYGDLHAHAMALPLTQVALAFAIQWALGGARRSRGRRPNHELTVYERVRHAVAAELPTPAGSLILAGLVAGALRATNTWDYPTYLALMSVGFYIGVLTRRARESHVRTPVGRDHPPLEQPEAALQPRLSVELLLGAATPVLLLACAELLLRPFAANYQVPYAAFELWEGSRTPVGIYLLMYGQTLFPVTVGAIVGLVALLRRHVASITKRLVAQVLATLAVALAVWGLLMLLLGILQISIATVVVPLGVVAALLLFWRRTPIRHRLIWFWVGTSLALSILVEGAVLKGDIGRMNTVFKFHLQVWMLLAVSGAVFLEWLLHSTNGLYDLLALAQSGVLGPEGPAAVDSSGQLDVTEAGEAPEARRQPGRRASEIVTGVAAVLVLGAALYPALAIPAKMRDRWVPSAPNTLDGMAYMRSAVQYERGAEIRTEADYRVIRWLQENVEGSPTIMEAQGEREYLWGARISIYTGLPAVAAWRWHQVQQRMIMPPGTVEARQQDVRGFYSTTSAERARSILMAYGVEYVILGPYERAYMLPEGLPKFVTMVQDGWLQVVYEDADSTVYRVSG